MIPPLMRPLLIAVVALALTVSGAAANNGATAAVMYDGTTLDLGRAQAVGTSTDRTIADGLRSRTVSATREEVTAAFDYDGGRGRPFAYLGAGCRDPGGHAESARFMTANMTEEKGLTG